MTGGFIYYFLYCLVRVAFFFWHPIYKVIGKENVPKGGRLLICANHSGMADPLWAIMSLKLGHIPRVLAKKEATKYPIVGWILNHLGVIGVDRDIADVHAIKECLRALKNEEQLLIFPEGTRVKNRAQSQPKAGALMFSARTNSPILPVYLTRRRFPWQPVAVVIGQTYMPPFAGKKVSDEDLAKYTAELMQKIYALEERI